MKKIFLPIAVIAVMALSAFTAINAVDYKIADGYSVKFTSKDPSGVFTSLKGDVSFDENNLAASKFNVTIDVKSINTGNGMQNHKALNDDWFQADKFPTITYTSKTITKTATGYQVVGTLNMHGVQKDVTIPFTFADNKFVGSFDINRLDYGVGTDKGMSGHASSVLKIDLSVPVTK